LLVDCCSSLCLAHCLQRLVAAALLPLPLAILLLLLQPLLRLLRRDDSSPASSR